MIEPSVSVDTRNFDRAFKEYLDASQKSLQEIVNKKAALIAAGAVRHTQKAAREKIEGDLGKWVNVGATQENKRTKRTLVLNVRKGHNAPLAALIINKRRMREGKDGLEGPAMDRAIKKMIGSRLRSIGFLASGWLGAVKDLLFHIKDKGGIKLIRSIKWYGKQKGSGMAAKSGWNPFATISNHIHKGNSKAEAIITAGVQASMDEEAKSMEAYVERKLAKDADRFNRS